MRNILKKIIQQLTERPKLLFLVDSLGALITTFFLLVVLRNFNEYFGMPKIIVNYLCIIASFLCIYSATCFLLLKDNWISYIRVVTIANLLYCILTIGVIIFHYPVLTTIGVSYFITEIIIICSLVYIEFNVASSIKKRMTNSFITP